MALSTRSDLRSAVSDWINRSDVSDSTLNDMIALAEARFRRDSRIRNPVFTTLSVDSQEEDLPDNFHELREVVHQGSEVFGALETAGIGRLEEINGREGDAAAAPTHVAVIGKSKLRFAPVPDDTYTLLLYYYETVPNLSSTLQSNWLLEDHPDIYLYGVLSESAGYLHHDERRQLWESRLEAAIEELDKDVQNREWSGPVRAKPPAFNP